MGPTIFELWVTETENWVIKTSNSNGLLITQIQSTYPNIAIQTRNKFIFSIIIFYFILINMKEMWASSFTPSQGTYLSSFHSLSLLPNIIFSCYYSNIGVYMKQQIILSMFFFSFPFFGSIPLPFNPLLVYMIGSEYLQLRQLNLRLYL